MKKEAAPKKFGWSLFALQKEGISGVYSVLFWLAILLVFFWVIFSIIRRMTAGGAG